MRYQKRFFVFALCVLLAAAVKFSSLGREFEEVEEFRGANIKQEVFNPLIAQSVNEKKLVVDINNYEYTNADTGVYMNDELVLMVPVEILRDCLNCSVKIYNDSRLVLQKKETQIIMELDEPVMIVREDGENSQTELSTGLTYTRGTFYLPLQVLSEVLDFSYAWNIEENYAVATNNSEKDSFLPYRYDLREQSRVGKMKDQGVFGTCWAFASLSALESTLQPEENLTFSPEHMSLRNSFSSDLNSGGEYTMGMAYLTAWQGPVLEESDPYGDGESPDDLKAVKHVQEIQILPSKDYERIKEAVFKYGGVQTSLYCELDGVESASTHYNPVTAAYCYLGEQRPNHDIVIIGWDDNYPKENFNTELEGDGAFICQNSWGSQFGDNGAFYVSYYDTNIGIHNIAYTRIEETDNYDRIYQTDLCGWVGQLGYNRNTIYGANVYETQSNEVLKAVGFYATGPDTEYEVYVVADFQGPDSLNNRRLAASGTLKNAGYYTIPVEKTFNLMEGKKYAVVVQLKTPGATKPMAVEYVSSETTQNVTLDDGEGYISARGNDWQRVESEYECNLCIKAYTKYRR